MAQINREGNVRFYASVITKYDWDMNDVVEVA